MLLCPKGRCGHVTVVCVILLFTAAMEEVDMLEMDKEKRSCCFYPW